MILRYQDNCKNCAHYRGNQTCQAFPTEIPIILWSGENPHDEPYPGDQGYRYESRHLSIPPMDDDVDEFEEPETQRQAA